MSRSGLTNRQDQLRRTRTPVRPPENHGLAKARSSSGFVCFSLGLVSGSFAFHAELFDTCPAFTFLSPGNVIYSV